ncbi:MAG: hypothetical protein N2450_09290 [bacterium]|nr:hypothetical protein [bacterium]
MAWRKAEIPPGMDFEQKEEDWEGYCFYWLPVKYFFGKAVNLENSFKELISTVSKEGLQFKPSPRILVEPGQFSGKVLVEIEKPDKYHAQVFSCEKGKVFSAEAIGDEAHVKKVMERQKQKVANEGYVIQGVYLWYLTDAPWDLKKNSRTVVFVRT